MTRTISFQQPCPDCGAPTEPHRGHRRCVECEWDNRAPDLFTDSPDAERES